MAAASSGSTSASSGAQAVSGDWPSDWREKISKGDTKALARLQRYASPAAALEALGHLQAKISAGELRAIPKKDASAEEVAAYRAALGVPENPDGYKPALAEGIVIGENDQPLVKGFLTAAHASDLTNEQVSATLNWYYAEAAREAEAIAQRDKQAALECQDALRKEWGDDYRGTVNAIFGMLDIAPPGVREKLLGKRLEDGKALASDPDVMRWFAQLARELNPAGTLVPGSGQSVAGSIDTEIQKIEKVMREDRQAYNRDEKMQERYRELLAAKEKMAARP